MWRLASAAMAVGCGGTCGTDYLGGGAVEVATTLPGARAVWRIPGASASDLESWHSAEDTWAPFDDGPGDGPGWAYGEVGRAPGDALRFVLAQAELAGAVSPCHPDGAVLELLLDLDAGELHLQVDEPFLVAFHGEPDEVAVDDPLRGSVRATGRWESPLCGIDLADEVHLSWAFDEDEIYSWKECSGSIVQMSN